MKIIMKMKIISKTIRKSKYISLYCYEILKDRLLTDNEINEILFKK
jgi:hypothetical protein